MTRTTKATLHKDWRMFFFFFRIPMTADGWVQILTMVFFAASAAFMGV